MDLMILNDDGGGTARGAAFALVAGRKQVSDLIGDGFMASGAKVLVQTDLPIDDNAECIVLWRNADESSWVLDRVGPARRLRRATRSGKARRRAKSTSLDEAWARCYPNDPLLGLPAGRREITIGKAT